MTNEVLVPVGTLLAACLIGGFWTFVFGAAFMMSAVVVKRRFLSGKRETETGKMSVMTENMTKTKTLADVPTETDLKELAYAVILRRISEIVAAKYPAARWVWEASDAKERIVLGHDVYILLNRAGGYRRARIDIRNLQVRGIIYESAEAIGENGSVYGEDIFSEEQQEDYELLAFEWTETHMCELNVRCNEALDHGLTEIYILADELPVRESWKDICRELIRAGMKKVSCVSEGIKINLMREMQKGNEL